MNIVRNFRIVEKLDFWLCWFSEVFFPGLSSSWSSSVGGTEFEKVVKHDLSVVLAVVGSIVSFVTLLVSFAPVGFEISRRWLIVIVMDEVCEDGMKGFGLVSEGNVMPTTFAFTCTSVGEKHDGDELRQEGLYLGILEEFRNFGGEGK